MVQLRRKRPSLSSEETRTRFGDQHSLSVDQKTTRWTKLRVLCEQLYDVGVELYTRL